MCVRVCVCVCIQVVQAHAVFTHLREKVEHFYNRVEARVLAPAASLHSPLHEIITYMGKYYFTLQQIGGTSPCASGLYSQKSST